MTRSRFVRFSSRCTWFAVGLRVVRLAHAQVLPNVANADVSQVAKAVAAYPSDNAIVVTDYADNVRRIAEIPAAGATSLAEVLRVTGGH
ncbi:hypothetical protein [Burkholderia stagnalis]|uniref:TonB-dependent receptor n=1 Tax=Burkholderia stagnalis TaxID=1503054 RepID=A0ABX9YHQ3_9BURK|nr:hypothetical protein [Burkholderia stagnalis]AOK56632.1 hypothetical protein WT74_28610 [Burkholderia stagnalis]KVM88850.1 hypothetical protein WT05_06825 [Burkholderia stagnalis]KVN62352.1 hypothetical protein WT14_14635 [Burkholderia stagnalis]KVN78416.1 hypothetical protein WT15_16030 [Burkholderia stagnalis]KWI40378.1 hypothetical protein WT71_33190 [Burkholderia stagnalis]